MGLQLVIGAEDLGEATKALADGEVACEVFTMPSSQIGISIPTKVFDSVGDAGMAKILGLFSYVDLWSGERCERYPK